ncbi:valine--tRNA ligase [Candidatus Kaiserbacteria bacterium]|nr:valine--tRNA ligase [Candidatus Kaiserbacteria bacterium]
MEPRNGVPEEFLKPYEPQAREDGIYAMWEQSGYFNPDNLPSERSEPFSIVLPPPNVTGTLHLGHAYEDTLQDIMIRYERMRGKKALWIPGTDSAAIATQARVEKNIQKAEGKSRHDLGREELVKRVHAFAKESENTILTQVRKMGASLDWSRYAYTLDDTRNRAVFTAFNRMYDAGLIYRGNRIVNWDPKGQTTISDDEIVHEERDSKLYTFKYAKDFPIAISTTRPETKVGDTAVAVHPDDERYAQYVGKEYDVTFCDVPLHIRIVADKSVEKEFGTGALGVTPAHSMIDWEIADRHDLPRPQVINEYAKMTVEGRLNNKKTTEARDMVVEWLREHDLLVSEEGVKQNVATSERTGGIIEPLPKLQWFIDVSKQVIFPDGRLSSLKERMHEAVASGAVSIAPERYEKIYFHWIENLRDWCISRQIWFGHRIPVWYRGEEIYCGVEAPEGDSWEQDPDVLDTWFSSALWTFSTLGWPDKTPDLATFHPTSFMSPAYEILQLWVSRMILMSTFHLGQVPFKQVIIHGLVRAKDGRKFSKSLNNGVDPLDMIEKYGADALRMGLIAGVAVGSDIKFDENKIKGYKNFANKLWNISRFVLENTQGVDHTAPLTDTDAALIAEAQAIAGTVSQQLDSYRPDLAADTVYHFIWDRFAAEILERTKPVFRGENIEEIASTKRMLYTILTISLKLLHPFMPFVTEAVWQNLPEKDADQLMIAAWPASRSQKDFSALEDIGD